MYGDSFDFNIAVKEKSNVDWNTLLYIHVTVHRNRFLFK